MWDANHNPADYEENLGRGQSTVAIFRLIIYSRVRYSAVACEVLARRVIHAAPPDRLHSLMSTRYKHRQLDGEISEVSSALEMAIDSHWYAANHLREKVAVTVFQHNLFVVQ
jgi:hypothetical protein